MFFLTPPLHALSKSALIVIPIPGVQRNRNRNNLPIILTGTFRLTLLAVIRPGEVNASSLGTVVDLLNKFK